MANKLMCHVVTGYPSVTECIELIIGMDKLGVKHIEVQIPFSDPIADGETIMQANDIALASGIDTKSSFRLIKEVTDKGISAKVYIMSYSQKLINCGIDDFCQQASSVGVTGLIIPDLPYDSPEYETLISGAKKNSLDIVPVVSPGMSTERLGGVLRNSGKLVYLTSTKGITGNKLLVSGELGEAAARVKQLKPDAKLAVGFGIQKSEDVDQVLEIADLAVIGSSVIRRIEKSGVTGGLKFIKSLSV
ncbi:MAG TPA: tryptophan synthase subunit alpha [Patescibacteria group bacterium]|nr:tryptophan synthase subunit alpha [Patescibacteria group bacterium]